MFYSPWSLYDEFPRYKTKRMKIFINSFKSISGFFFVKYLQQTVEVFKGKQGFCTVRYQAMMHISTNSRKLDVFLVFFLKEGEGRGGEGREGEKN